MFSEPYIASDLKYYHISASFKHLIRLFLLDSPPSKDRVDVRLPGHGDTDGKPGVVDLGGGGRLQEGEERRQDGLEELLQETPPAD